MYMTTQDGQGEENFAAMFAESLGQDNVKEGEILRGTVIAVGKDYAIVDVGYKSEGQVPLEEFRQADGTIGVKPGDVVDVLLEARENDAGMCVLSKEKADRFKVWDEISAACERDELIEGTISQRVKGGLSVTIRGGVKAFLPGSQVDLRPIRTDKRHKPIRLLTRHRIFGRSLQLRSKSFITGHVSVRNERHHAQACDAGLSCFQGWK